MVDAWVVLREAAASSLRAGGRPAASLGLAREGIYLGSVFARPAQGGLDTVQAVREMGLLAAAMRVDQVLYVTPTSHLDPQYADEDPRQVVGQALFQVAYSVAGLERAEAWAFHLGDDHCAVFEGDEPEDVTEELRTSMRPGELAVLLMAMPGWTGPALAVPEAAALLLSWGHGVHIGTGREQG